MNRKNGKSGKTSICMFLAVTLQLSLIRINRNISKYSGSRAIEITAYNGTSFGYNSGQE